MNLSNKNYPKLLNKYIQVIKEIGFEKIEKTRLEFQFESLMDWSIFMSVDELKKWYEDRKKQENMSIEIIPLNECKNWTVSNDRVFNNYEEFFSIEGVRVRNTNNREVYFGWDQPILKQVGFDGGILGLLRKRFNGIPHYLIEAKAEPGNPNFVQISPSLQATFSNIKKAHKGSEPNYLDFFINPDKHSALIHYKCWLAEDGGRFLKKRNLNMLVEIPEDFDLPLKKTFTWVSLYQIKKLLQEETCVNPHVRGIISHL